jgi:hypothetical protein
LDAGSREPNGSKWIFLSSIVLTAFAFEAYLNHVGPTVLTSWKGLERLSPLPKLDLLCEVLKVNFSGPKNKRAVKTIGELFKFRNTLAHGRTETITATPKRLAVDKIDGHLAPRLLIHWEQLIENSRFAKRVRADVEIVVHLIHDARPEPKEYPFTFGLGFHAARLEAM